MQTQEYALPSRPKCVNCFLIRAVSKQERAGDQSKRRLARPSQVQSICMQSHTSVRHVKIRITNKTRQSRHPAARLGDGNCSQEIKKQAVLSGPLLSCENSVHTNDAVRRAGLGVGAPR